MNRTLTYRITENDIPHTIQSFLRDKGYSAQIIKELKKMPESILIDGRWEYMRHPLSPGETLTVRIQEEHHSEKIPPVSIALNILYEDEDLMVLNKPAGLPIHPSLNHYYDSLANGLAWYFEQQGKPFIFRCVNRLDRDTSGLTIVAKHILSAGILSAMAANRQIQREYLAIADGMVTPEQGVIIAPIGRADTSIIERRVDFEKGEHAVTHYQVLEYKKGYSLLSIHLETGRTHQIRVHMKYIGHPLAGDFLYNSDAGEHASPMKRQALHSCRLAFPHPITGEWLEFRAPLPKDMASLLAE